MRTYIVNGQRMTEEEYAAYLAAQTAEDSAPTNDDDEELSDAVE